MKYILTAGLAILLMVSCKKTEESPAASADVREQFTGVYGKTESTIMVLAQGDTFDSQTFTDTMFVEKSKTHSDRLDFITVDGLLFYADAIESNGDALTFRIPHQAMLDGDDTAAIQGNMRFDINGKTCAGYKRNGIVYASIKVEYKSLPGAVILYDAVLYK